MDLLKDNLRKYLSYAVQRSKSPFPSHEGFSLTGVYLIDGVMFHSDEELISLEEKVIELALKKYGKTNVSDVEISNKLKKFSARQATIQTDQTEEVYAHLHETVNTKRTLVYPNYGLLLDIDVPKFVVGRVTFTHKYQLSAICPQINTDLIGPSSDLEKKSAITMCDLPAQCCAVTVISSELRSHTLAQWYVDIAQSLIRLFVVKSKKGNGHIPWIGDTDPPVFFPQSDTLSSVIVREDQNSAAYSVHNPSTQPYYISNEVHMLLTTTNFESGTFDNICETIFSPPSNTVSERLQKALGWMTRGRLSLDLPTRFLFFFTALEALLTQGRDEPILDSMARNVATIIAAMEYRPFVYRKIKDMYATRSRLVHGGMIDVSESECNILQQYVEITCAVLIDTSLNMKFDDFAKELKECSFGKPWKPKSE